MNVRCCASRANLRCDLECVWGDAHKPRPYSPTLCRHQLQDIPCSAEQHQMVVLLATSHHNARYSRTSARCRDSATVTVGGLDDSAQPDDPQVDRTVERRRREW